MPTQPLTPEQKANWNRFIDFVAAQKMTGSPLLDQRNKQVGMSLLQKFNYANPKYALPTDIVPVVQQNLQDYRTNLVNQYKAGKIAASPDIKSEADIMAHISPVDGWPGTRTLSSKFPVAQASTTDPAGKTTVKDYGVNVDQYDKDRGIATTK